MLYLLTILVSFLIACFYYGRDLKLNKIWKIKLVYRQDHYRVYARERFNIWKWLNNYHFYIGKDHFRIYSTYYSKEEAYEDIKLLKEAVKRSKRTSKNIAEWKIF